MKFRSQGSRQSPTRAFFVSIFLLPLMAIMTRGQCTEFYKRPDSKWCDKYAGQPGDCQHQQIELVNVVSNLSFVTMIQFGLAFISAAVVVVVFATEMSEQCQICKKHPIILPVLRLIVRSMIIGVWMSVLLNCGLNIVVRGFQLLNGAIQSKAQQLLDKACVPPRTSTHHALQELTFDSDNVCIWTSVVGMISSVPLYWMDCILLKKLCPRYCHRTNLHGNDGLYRGNLYETNQSCCGRKVDSILSMFKLIYEFGLVVCDVLLALALARRQYLRASLSQTILSGDEWCASCLDGQVLCSQALETSFFFNNTYFYVVLVSLLCALIVVLGYFLGRCHRECTICKRGDGLPLPVLGHEN